MTATKAPNLPHEILQIKNGYRYGKSVHCVHLWFLVNATWMASPGAVQAVIPARAMAGGG
jgi:hypothetical protein